MSARRFALDDGSGLRLARWVGRGLALFAMWPLGYALFGKSTFDWEAMMFGGPAMLIGLWLWGWAGHRLRHPRAYLEIDRRAGVARLQRDGEPIVCELDRLGGWSFTSWKVTNTNTKSRTVTTWHAARCPGFGEQNLYVDLGADACRAWTAEIDAAVRGELATGKRTLGDLLAERFDAVIAAGDGSVATIGLTLATGLGAYAMVQQIARTDGEALEAAIVLAIVFAVLALGWRSTRGPALAAGIAALPGLALVSKPWLAPVTRELMGEVHRMSPTSETHLYFVIPGLGLCVLAAALLSTIEVRKPASAAPIRSEPAKLDPPRPKPPEPPTSSAP